MGGKVSRPAVNQIATPRSCHSSGGVIIRAKPPIVPEVFARRKEQLSYAEPLFLLPHVPGLGKDVWIRQYAPFRRANTIHIFLYKD